MIWVTRAFLFAVTWVCAEASAAAGLGYWPAFFALAAVVVWANLRVDHRAATGAAIIGVGIIAVTVANAALSSPWWELFATSFWLAVAAVIGLWIKLVWAGRFVWGMFLGYNGLLLLEDPDYILASWYVVEFLGVAAILSLGNALHEKFVRACDYTGGRIGGPSRDRSAVGRLAGGAVAVRGSVAAPVEKKPKKG